MPKWINIDQSQTSIGPKLDSCEYGCRLIRHAEEENWNMSRINKVPKLRKAPQPPLSHAGAIPDSDRAKRPSLHRPSGPDPELTPGDRVEGLGDFGKPTDEFGTVERANEDDAIVKWDDDGRTRVHQPWLKKV
jgi:hypothetical protein